MDNPIFWACAHALAFVLMAAIIIVRPGYWAGSMMWFPAILQMITSIARGRVAPTAARTRWQFTCLVCGAGACAMTAIAYLALYAALPDAEWMVWVGRIWILLIIAAFAFGSLSSGRAGHAA